MIMQLGKLHIHILEMIEQLGSVSHTYSKYIQNAIRSFSFWFVQHII